MKLLLKNRLVCASIVVLAAVSAVQAEKSGKTDATSSATAKSKPHAGNQPAEKKPPEANLPRVLIIGDSISLGYTPVVQKLLKGKVVVVHPPVNCQDTGFGLANLAKWIGKEKWDVIHFNWGIWDTHLMDNKTGKLVMNENAADPQAVHVRHTAEQYGENLTKLVEMLKATHAKLIWATTTPVMFRQGERLKVTSQYNEVAAGIMKKNNIPTDDLEACVAQDIAKLQLPDKAHFTKEGYERLGNQVANSILAALNMPPLPTSQPAKDASEPKASAKGK